MLRNRFLIVWILTGLAVAPQALAQEGTHAHWGYSGEVGPDKWGTLSPEFRMCTEGKNQSPIDLSGMIEAQLESISFAYKPGSLEILHNGHTVQINYEPGSTITISEQTFELAQFHFHAPSENTIGGQSFPLEAHLVHKDVGGNLAVISVMFQEGMPNATLEQLWKSLPEKAGTKTALPARVDVSGLLPKDRDYFSYNGSLTTPPCSEGVRWMVMKGSMTASRDQIRRFQTAIGFANNRPIQPINARQILK